MYSFCTISPSGSRHACISGYLTGKYSERLCVSCTASRWIGEGESVESRNDFSKGNIAKNILSLALPMTLAQLINVLYNIVDRLYIGQLKEEATLSLTGLGLCLPIISIVIAFANLFGMGGAPLCSIGKRQQRRSRSHYGKFLCHDGHCRPDPYCSGTDI